MVKVTFGGRGRRQIWRNIKAYLLRSRPVTAELQLLPEIAVDSSEVTMAEFKKRERKRKREKPELNPQWSHKKSQGPLYMLVVSVARQRDKQISRVHRSI